MSDNVYSVSEIVGSSTDGIDDAVKGAIGRASKTLHNLDWFEGCVKLTVELVFVC
jgi:flavin-binding protein dodecin